ncbi:uncharacterized protein LOC111357056 [Spodoptera litura]|uniref:Uncharacterized protein LOC111357056 n=1 Tax=Spodoptera litura TaxID=69820 RepID=A0A9J7IW99_SPOLT|nr:uncharacterized protein LOC111357056 [Spodoptera litura]
MFHKSVLILSLWCILSVIWPNEATGGDDTGNVEGREQKELDKRAPRPPNQFEQMQSKMQLPPLELITYGPTLVFEGVDYDLLPTNIYPIYYDCYYLHTKCVRDLANFNEHCAYHRKLKRWLSFATFCDIDLINCLHREETGKGIFGQDMADDTLFVQADGYECRGKQ